MSGRDISTCFVLGTTLITGGRFSSDSQSILWGWTSQSLHLTAHLKLCHASHSTLQATMKQTLVTTKTLKALHERNSCQASHSYRLSMLQTLVTRVTLGTLKALHETNSVMRVTFISNALEWEERVGKMMLRRTIIPQLVKVNQFVV